MMERNKTSKIIVGTILVVSFCGITLLLSGCSELAALEENQLKIQQMMENDSQRTAGDIASIERNQLTLRSKIESDSQSLARDLTSMEQNQQQLQKLMQDSGRQIAQVDSGIKSSSEALAGNIAAVQQNQLDLRGGIQSSEKTLSSKIAVLAQNQDRLEQMMHGSNQHFASGLTSLQKGQQNLQSGIEANSKAIVSNIEALVRTQRNLQGGIEANSQAIVANISAMEKNQIEMRGSIELQIARMIKSIDVLGQNQDRLTQAVARNSLQLSQSRETEVSLEKSLANLKQMIADVQNNTRNVNARVVVVNDNQFKLQQGLDDKIRNMMSNVERIEVSLNRLHDMVAVVQTNTEQVNTKVALLENTQKQLSRDVESRIQQVVKNIESLERLSSKVVNEPKVEQNSDTEQAKPAASE